MGQTTGDYAYQCPRMVRSYIALCISIIFTARAARFVFSKAVIVMIAYILACIYLLCTNTVCVCVCVCTCACVFPGRLKCQTCSSVFRRGEAMGNTRVG